MSRIKSRNGGRVSGRRINSLVEKARLMGDEVPLEESRRMSHPAHIAMISVEGEDGPPLGVSGSGYVDADRIRGMFRDDEQFAVSMEDGYLVFSKGPKDVYWFPVEAHRLDEPEAVPIAPDTTFDIDPAELARRTDHVIIEAGYSRNGGRTVFVSFYDKSNGFIRGVDLDTPWEGKESISAYSGDIVAGWGALGRKAKVSMGTAHPIRLDGTDDGVEYNYILAPRLEGTRDGGASLREREMSARERGWVASRNARPLPSDVSVVEADCRRIEETFGGRQRFIEWVDEMLAGGSPSPYDAVYSWYIASSRIVPRRVVADYLFRTIGPDYRSYGDEFEVYARLLARDGASMYGGWRPPKRKEGGKGRRRGRAGARRRRDAWKRFERR